MSCSMRVPRMPRIGPHFEGHQLSRFDCQLLFQPRGTALLHTVRQRKYCIVIGWRGCTLHLLI